MAIKVKVIGSSGKATGQEYTAKDRDHAARIEARVKAQAGPGNSITFARREV